MKNLDWKMCVIFVLAIALALMIGAGYESQYVQNLQQRNWQLEQLKLATQTFANSLDDLQSRSIFKRLGYDVDMTIEPQDTTEENGATN